MFATIHYGIDYKRSAYEISGRPIIHIIRIKVTRIKVDSALQASCRLESTVRLHVG